MSGQSATLSISEAKAMQNRTCASGCDHQGGSGSSKGMGAGEMHTMKKTQKKSEGYNK